MDTYMELELESEPTLVFGEEFEQAFDGDVGAPPIPKESDTTIQTQPITRRPKPRPKQVNNNKKPVHEFNIPHYALQRYYSTMLPIERIWETIESARPEGMPRMTETEFGFTWKNGSFSRNMYFSNPLELKDFLTSKVPYSIHVGCGHSGKTSQKSLYAQSYAPAVDELVFDVDLDDYRPFRLCCQATGRMIMCDRCMELSKCAMACLEYFLVDMMGFKDVRFYFSGRRGIHCWVMCKDATATTARMRSAITDFLSPWNGKPKEIKVIRYILHPLPGAYQSLYEKAIRPYFETVWNKQRYAMDIDCLKYIEDNAFSHILSMEPRRQDLVDSCRYFMDSLFARKDISPDQNVTFDTLNEILENSFEEEEWRTSVLVRIGLMVCLPRLDEAVTKRREHLLKIPMGVHPETGYVCSRLNPPSNASGPYASLLDAIEPLFSNVENRIRLKICVGP